MQETTLSSKAVYNAQPTILVGAKENFWVTEQMLGFEMREQEGGMSSLELRFSNLGSFTDGSAKEIFDDGEILKLGVMMEVYAGEESSPTQIFRGPITAIEGRYNLGPAEWIVLAEDPLQVARMTRRSKTWDKVKLADIVQQVASQLGLTPQVHGLDQGLGTHVQFNETDLQFLRRLLARYDADIQVAGTELHASPRNDVQRNVIQLNLKSQLSEVRVITDLAHQVSQATISGWDNRQASKIAAASATSTFGPGIGNTGKDWLLQALGPRTEHITQITSASSDEAQSLVDTEFRQRMQSFVVAEGTCEGNPGLRVGTHLILTGLGKRFSNTYYVTSTLHRYDKLAGYKTEFTAECAYLGGAM